LGFARFPVSPGDTGFCGERIPARSSCLLKYARASPKFIARESNQKAHPYASEGHP
jgi:hypothetical protein